MATNTTNTFTNHTGNGTEVNFSISFSYILTSDIDVTVAGVTKTLGTHYTISGSTVTFTSGNVPANGAAIKFQRDTSISTKAVDFQDGSVLTEQDLDNNTNQVLFAQQEIIDKLGGIEEGATGDQTAAEIRTLVESASDSNVFTDADHSKLNAIEASATADQTAAEIRTLVESASDSNVFTDADHTKLNGIEASATADQTAAEIRTLVESATDSNVFTDADHTKLNGIETGATADQTNAEIRAAVEAATDSNVFTDADHSKLNGIEAGATADQTNAEIKTAYENNSDTNAFTDALQTKLNGIETAATADQTASEILAKLLTVDGPSSGLNADLLDGLDSGDFVRPDDDAQLNTLHLDSASGPSLAQGSNNSNLKVQGGGGTSVGITGYDSSGNWDFQIYGAGGQQGFLTSNWGGWGAYCDTSGNWTANGNVTAYSDEKLKDNIEPIENPIQKLKAIQGVTYNRNDIEGNPRHTGVVAQQVERVLPEVVMTNDDGIKTVAYGNMVGLLIEAIKEQQDEIERLRAIIEG